MTEATNVLAQLAYNYAVDHYGDRDARFDVIVECMTIAEIERELIEDGVATEDGAIEWARQTAGAQFEQQLNQAWDGPESVWSSSRYDPDHDPAGRMDEAEFSMMEEARIAREEAAAEARVSPADREWDRIQQKWEDRRNGL